MWEPDAFNQNGIRQRHTCNACHSLSRMAIRLRRTSAQSGPRSRMYGAAMLRDHFDPGIIGGQPQMCFWHCRLHIVHKPKSAAPKMTENVKYQHQCIIHEIFVTDLRVTTCFTISREQGSCPDSPDICWQDLLRKCPRCMNDRSAQTIDQAAMSKLPHVSKASYGALT